MTNNERAANTARQSLAQSQQRASEWERRAKEYEGDLEMTRTQLEQAEQTYTQLNNDYTHMKSQLEGKEADSRLASRLAQVYYYAFRISMHTEFPYRIGKITCRIRFRRSRPLSHTSKMNLRKSNLRRHLLRRLRFIRMAMVHLHLDQTRAPALHTARVALVPGTVRVRQLHESMALAQGATHLLRHPFGIQCMRPKPHPRHDLAILILGLPPQDLDRRVTSQRGRLHRHPVQSLPRQRKAMMAGGHKRLIPAEIDLRTPMLTNLFNLTICSSLSVLDNTLFNQPLGFLLCYSLTEPFIIRTVSFIDYINIPSFVATLYTREWICINVRVLEYRDKAHPTKISETEI